MLETRSKQIGPNTYDVTQLGALKGRAVFTRLLKVTGPAVAALAGGGKLSEAKAGEALSKLADSLSEEDVAYLCDAFSPMTHVHLAGTGKSPKLSDVFDTHFAGNYGELLKWLAFCLEVNFGSFFGDLGLNLGQVQAGA